MSKRSDILSTDGLYGAAIDKRKLLVPKGANILQKPLAAAVKSYAPKRGTRARPLPPFKNTQAIQDMSYLNDPPPISEEAISQGMISLVSKGLIPKDVDLTPAFEKGAVMAMTIIPLPLLETGRGADSWPCITSLLSEGKCW